MAIVAALTDVDVESRQFERGVGTHALHLFDRALQVEERQDFHKAPDRDNDQDAQQQEDRVLLDNRVLFPE